MSPRSVSDLERGINRTARRDTAELLGGTLGLAGPATRTAPCESGSCRFSLIGRFPPAPV